MDSTKEHTARRHSDERRNMSWRTVVQGFARSRRRTHRRQTDQQVVFLDWHHPWLFFLATGTMILSAADAFLTLQLLARGMIEVNPIMNAVMAQSTWLFAALKLMLTAFGIFILVYLAKVQFMNRVRAGLILTVFFTGYCCLVCYELVNLFNLL